MKINAVVGMVDGPSCVSKLPLVAVVVFSRAEVEALKEEAGKSEGDTLSPERGECEEGVTGEYEGLEDVDDAPE